MTTWSQQTSNVLVLQLDRSRKPQVIINFSLGCNANQSTVSAPSSFDLRFPDNLKWYVEPRIILSQYWHINITKHKISTWTPRRENYTSLKIPASSWRLQVYQPIQGAWSRNQPPCCCISRPTIQWVRPERSYMSTLIPMFHKRHGMIECIIQSGQTWILLFRAYCTVPSKFPSLNWRF